VEEVLRRLGPAEELARDYSNGALLRRANRSRSPWFILRATYHWAKTGVQGLTIFLLALIGYACGAAFVICAFLKPLFPGNIGWGQAASTSASHTASKAERNCSARGLLKSPFSSASDSSSSQRLRGALLPKLKNSRRLAQGAAKMATTA
jgi:hypothetical protein